MEEKELEKLQFPIGRFVVPSEIQTTDIEQWIAEIASFPQRLAALTERLSSRELNWRYRPDGWTIKQVVHHCADSHMNSVMRFKLALTEDAPTIRPYMEDRWAELPDSLDDQVSHTLELLNGLHYRWVLLLKTLSKSDLDRTFVHPEHGQIFTLKETIANYAWHCAHHLAHVEQALAEKGKYL